MLNNFKNYRNTIKKLKLEIITDLFLLKKLCSIKIVKKNKILFFLKLTFKLIFEINISTFDKIVNKKKITYTLPQNDKKYFIFLNMIYM